LIKYFAKRRDWTLKAKMFWCWIAAALFLFGCAIKNERCILKYYPYPGLSCEKQFKNFADSDDNDEYQIEYSLYRCYPGKKFGKIIEEHISAMHAASWFKKICWQDFFHGHVLVVPGAKKKYASPEEFFKSIKAVIYHTHEFDDCRENEVRKGIPLGKRTHRSLIGYLDGRVQPLCDIVNISNLSNENIMIYAAYGTIYPADYFKQTKYAQEVGDGFSINICGIEYDLKPILWVVKRKLGKYSVGGQRYDIFMKFLK